MKGFKLNDEELWDMLNIFKNELEEYIGEFDGEVYVNMEYYSIVISLDDEKYVCSEAVVRKIESFFSTSQFNRAAFNLDSEMKYSIELKYKGNDL